MKLTVAFITGRSEPHLGWVVRGLTEQAKPGDEIEVLVVDALDRCVEMLISDPPLRDAQRGGVYAIRVAPPKPTIWQGPHRVTSCDWWALSNARNTALVLAEHDYVAFLDDACRLGPDWLNVVRHGSHARRSVLAGTYDKLERVGPGGEIKRTVDHRRAAAPSGKLDCGGGWLFGCTFALPLAWALEVNGFEEGCDGLSMEDVIFGLHLQNTGHRIDFAPSMRVEQDRGEPATAQGNSSRTYRRTDKGVSPNDKSHAALARFGKRRRTDPALTPDLAALRASIAAGEPWPTPDPDVEPRDWYDGQRIRDMVPPP